MGSVADKRGTKSSESQIPQPWYHQHVRASTHPVATYTETPMGIRNKAAYAFIPVRAVTTVPPPSNIQDETIELQTRPHHKKARCPARPNRIYATWGCVQSVMAGSITVMVPQGRWSPGWHSS